MKKIPLIVIIAIPFSSIAEFIAKYVYHDTDYLMFLGVLVVVDTTLGVIKHWIAHDVSSKRFADFWQKLIIYPAILIMSHVLMACKIQQSAPLIEVSWFGNICCSLMLAREALSIVENIEAIHHGFFPAWLIRRLKDFDSKNCSKL